MKLQTNRALPALFVSARIAHTVLMPVSAAAADRPDFSTTNAIILTPPAPATPRINGPKIFGVRPGSPFLYTIPATGERQ